jgi:multidrug transporter EmrE-like cation transporter
VTIWNTASEARHGRRRLAHWALWVALPLLGLGYQVAAKQTAGGLGARAFGPDWLVDAAISPWMWAMVVMEIASFVAWMAVLAEMKLSAAFPLSAVGYVLVVAAGWTVFHEPANALQIVGGLAILAGVCLIGRSPAAAAPPC